MKRPPDPGHLEKERDRLIGHIHAAFADVSRDGGVSWSEAGVIDDYGTAEERARARAADTDRHWPELVDDPTWQPALGLFSYLDAVGFRYYLPAAMLRSLRERRDVGIAFFLTAPPDPRNAPLRELFTASLSLLDPKQRSCVARFVRFMVADMEAQGEEAAGFGAGPWREALESYWRVEE